MVFIKVGPSGSTLRTGRLGSAFQYPRVGLGLAGLDGLPRDGRMRKDSCKEILIGRRGKTSSATDSALAA
jgi:hypothetical protein